MYVLQLRKRENQSFLRSKGNNTSFLVKKFTCSYLFKNMVHLITKSFFCYTGGSSIKTPLCSAINQHSWNHIHFAHTLQFTQQGLTTFFKQK